MFLCIYIYTSTFVAVVFFFTKIRILREMKMKRKKSNIFLYTSFSSSALFQPAHGQTRTGPVSLFRFLCGLRSNGRAEIQPSSKIRAGQTCMFFRLFLLFLSQSFSCSIVFSREMLLSLKHKIYFISGTFSSFFLWYFMIASISFSFSLSTSNFLKSGLN